jgi:flagellar hook-associated protein 2
MSETRPDIISALNRSGSGIELQSLVSGLVEAETSGQRSLTQRRVEDTSTTISAMGQLSQEIGLFRTGMSKAAETASRSAGSSSSAVSIDVTNEAAAKDISAAISVEELASPQVLTFKFDANTTRSSAVSTGSISLDTPAWTDPRTAEVSANDATLGGLVDAINDVEGLTASLLETGNGLAMVVKAEDGINNALDANSITALRTALGMTANAVDGTTDSAENPFGADTEETEAKNARFTVDGLTITRASNEIDDLFTGHTVTLNAVGTSNLTSAETSASLKDRVNGFLAEVNALRSYLETATQRGVNGAEPGPLAGDRSAQSVLDRLKSLTTQPIPGFGDEPVSLAQLGIQTERDGSLSLNESVFDTRIAENPDMAQAIFATQYSADDDRVAVTGLSFAPPQPGRYELIYDPATSPTTATLNGEALSVSTNSAGKIVLRSTSDGTNGMSMTLDQDVAITTTVGYGESLADQMGSYADDLLGRDGVLARRETQLGEDLLGFELSLEAIEEKAAALTERYNIQFGRMEAVITSLNKTGEYMQSLMDSWNKDS